MNSVVMERDERTGEEAFTIFCSYCGFVYETFEDVHLCTHPLWKGYLIDIDDIIIGDALEQGISLEKL